MPGPALPRDSEIDSQRILTLAALLGPARLDTLLATLQARLHAFRTRWADQPETLLMALPEAVGDIHKSLGSANSLGLVTLGQALAELEALIRGGADHRDGIAGLLQKCQDLYVSGRREVKAILPDI